jgi:hypothetical protein
MAVIHRLAMALLVVVSGLPAAESWPGWRGRAEHLVVVVIDGPRWSETWGEPTRAHIPVQAKRILPLGGFCPDFANDGWTYTNCGHAAITTGFYEQIENQGNQLPAHVGLFQRFLAATGKPAESCWVITSKRKLHILGDSVDPAWNGKFTPRLDCGIPGIPEPGFRDDEATTIRVQEVLKTAHPALMLVNLRTPDSFGHAQDKAGYLEAIRLTDHLVGRIWATIQEDSVLRDRTNLFITNDHGRHLDGIKDGYISHGDACPGCRKISLLAVGPDIIPGAVSTKRRNQLDLAATWAWLAGIELPGTPGTVMHELLVSSR